MSRHRCFEITTPGGAQIRINGDPQMPRETLDALMAMADAVMQQFSQLPAPTEFRADGWPLCPLCGEDELWSPLIWDNLDERPPLEAFIAAGLRCYKCGWAVEKGTGS